MDSTIEIQGKQLKLSNLEKVLYPAAGFTKQQVIDYYVRIAPAMIPHLKDRPLTRKRYPNGVDAEFFYEKNAPQHRPDWVKTVPIWSEGNRRMVHYILANDLPTLVWLANLAAIELHPSLSLAKDITCPTMMVFDLDPGPPATIVQCCQVGLWLREIFEHFGLQSFPKTSGSKGLQIYVPLNTPTSYESTKPFAHALAQLLEHDHPDMVVSDMKKKIRTGKGFCRLEPERPTQNNGGGVLTAGARTSHRFDAGDMGRSRARLQKERRRPACIRSGTNGEACREDGRLVRSPADIEATVARSQETCGLHGRRQRRRQFRLPLRQRRSQKSHAVVLFEKPRRNQ